MLDQVKFGEKLRNYRKSLGMTQEELAERVGVSGQAVSKWESGECLPDCYNLKLLGDIFGISLDILLDTATESDINATARRIKQLATEYVWAKMSSRTDKSAYSELGRDLWMMHRAIFSPKRATGRYRTVKKRQANAALGASMAAKYGTTPA